MNQMNKSHKQSIAERYRKVLKTNDVDGIKILSKTRKRAYELGYTEEQLQEVYREVRNESNANKQAPKPEPTPQAQPTTPAPTKVDAAPRARAQLRSRTQESLPTVPGLNPSGGKQRQSKLSILGLADGKQTI